MSDARLYLDNAATSWPKPPGVSEAVSRYLVECGAPAGRGVYQEALEVERCLATLRKQLSVLLGVERPDQIVFTLNGTDALNMAIHGLLAAGDHVVTSVVEHNSVLRPLNHWQQNHAVDVTVLPCDGRGMVDPEAVEAVLRPNTRLVVLSHASNVTGVLQPIGSIGQLTRQRGIPLLVDAAQSLGQTPVDVTELGADLLAAPGHKGLLGPLGTGFLYVADSVSDQLRPVRQGGTGTSSHEVKQPVALPERLEAGNLNVPGLVGLESALQFIHAQGGVEAICQHHRKLTEKLLQGLVKISGVTLLGSSDLSCRVGIVSITISGCDPQELATLLDATYRIQVRAGLHCAPRMHESLGTIATGGALRFSIGPFNVEAEIDRAIEATAEIVAAL